jgi:hypothetical protein
MSRRDTGKTSRLTISLRILLLTVTPVPVIVHLLCRNEVGFVPWKLYLGCYGTGLFGIFVIWAFTNTCIYFMYRNEPGWMHWYRSGGDPFFDSLPLFNWDSWEVSCASPPLVCPVCGSAMPNWNCAQCQVWFDGKQFFQSPTG